MILEHVWDESFEALTNIVDVSVRHLRAKVEDLFSSKLSRTVRGVGFPGRLNAVLSKALTACNFFPSRGSVLEDREAMKCEELLKYLNEYVDGAVDPCVCEEFEKHMAGCNPCKVVVDNIRKTITLYKEGQPYELPAGFRQRLHTALRQRWKETHSGNE